MNFFIRIFKKINRKAELVHGGLKNLKWDKKTEIGINFKQINMNKKNIFIAFLLLVCISINAQKNDTSSPKSIELRLNDDYSLSTTKRVFRALNIRTLQREDEKDENNGLPPRFGYPIDVNFNPTNSGIWKVLPNGDRLWRLEIECIDAVSINLLYDKFWLPNGAKLHLYSKNKSQVIGGFSSENNRGTKQNPSKFTTGLLFSESIVLELFEPLVVKNQSIVSVDKVVHGYREIGLTNMMTNEAVRGISGDCQVNVNCSEGRNWQNEKKGVAMILVNGFRVCSGSLINNTSNNQKPYFLTADHCIGSLDADENTDASFYSFWWNYESYTCARNSSDFVAKSTSGATLVANNYASDFALFELAESPLDNNIDVFFNGWDRTTDPTQAGVGIHHPNGDFKKISTHNMIPGPGEVWGTNTHWRVNWSETRNGYSVTEGGSSGSPLFTTDKRIIGQLHGGSKINCSDPANDPGEYGRFHVSWNGSRPQRRLKDWLDPLNTGQSYLDGIGLDLCVPSRNITQKVFSGNTDNQKAKYSITASNIIEYNATANYSAGTEVILKTSFHAKVGSRFHSSIENCTENGSKLARITSNNVENNDFIKVKNNKNLSFLIYPNPAKTKITISSDFESLVGFKVNLYNHLGALLKSTRIINDNTTLNIADITNGLYIVKLYNLNTVIGIQKLIIHH